MEREPRWALSLLDGLTNIGDKPAAQLFPGCLAPDTAVSAFWVMDSVPMVRVVFETHEFAKYPLTIYPVAITVLLTFLIPYGLASYYPASYLLGKETPLILAWIAPLVALILLFIGYRFWLFGLRHYASTGS